MIKEIRRVRRRSRLEPTQAQLDAWARRGWRVAAITDLFTIVERSVPEKGEDDGARDDPEGSDPRESVII